MKFDVVRELVSEKAYLSEKFYVFGLEWMTFLTEL